MKFQVDFAKLSLSLRHDPMNYQKQAKLIFLCAT